MFETYLRYGLKTGVMATLNSSAKETVCRIEAICRFKAVMYVALVVRCLLPSLTLNAISCIMH
jgi:hypothetical protein